MANKITKSQAAAASKTLAAYTKQQSIIAAKKGKEAAKTGLKKVGNALSEFKAKYL